MFGAAPDELDKGFGGFYPFSTVVINDSGYQVILFHDLAAPAKLELGGRKFYSNSRYGGGLSSNGGIGAEGDIGPMAGMEGGSDQVAHHDFGLRIVCRGAAE